MIENPNRWLCASLFLSKCNWHLVLADMIKPLINLLNEKGILVKFQLAFDQCPTDNIRLAMLIPHKKRHSIAKQLDALFLDFLEQNRLFPVTIQACEPHIFMAYANNTIQYGLYSLSYANENQTKGRLEEAFSRTMLAGLVDNEVDDDLILTFALYIFFSCLKNFQVEKSLAKSWIMSYQILTNDLKNEEGDRIIDNEYALIEQNIDEIYADIFTPNMLVDCSWMKAWEDCFILALTQITEDEKMPFVCHVNQIINKQLNLNKDTQRFLGAIIQKAIHKNGTYAL